MTTDFGYSEKTIQTTGPIRPGVKNAPVDVRTIVNVYADIASIPNPYVGLTVTVKADETNSGKMTDYKVISLKANNYGVADTVVNEVKRMSEYLEVAINEDGSAIPSDYASKSYVDTSKEEAKEYTDNAINSALDGHTFKFLTQAEYDLLSDEEKNNPLIEYHITDASNTSSSSVSEEFVDNSIKAALDNKTVKVLTKSQWDSLSVKDDNVIYMVME